MPGSKEQKRKRQKHSFPGKEKQEQKPQTSPKAIASKKQNASSSHENLEGLISQLSKQVADPTAKSQVSSTKAQRIEKRAAKQQRRKERKEQQQQAASSKRAPATEDISASKKRAAPHQDDTEDRKNSWRTTQQTRKRLKTVTGLVKNIVKEQIHQEKGSHSTNKRGPQKQFAGFDLKKKKTKKWDEENVQPRPKDYGGLGLALPSLFLSFEDPSFIRRLEDEFQEHIDGFFGKQRTKAMKKQLDGDMLWRKMSKVKTGKQKVDGKKLSDMTPDQRVEAMLKAGLL